MEPSGKHWSGQNGNGRSGKGSIAKDWTGMDRQEWKGQDRSGRERIAVGRPKRIGRHGLIGSAAESN